METDCAGCEYQAPDLWPENDEAWFLWMKVQTQWRTTGFGLVGLDYRAVTEGAELYQVEMTACLMEKIRALERYEKNRTED